MKTRTRSYRQAEVMSSTPEQLVPLFYRELLKSLRIGHGHIENRDIPGKAEHLGRARALLLELLGALDCERGGDLSGRLASLYSYFLHEIDEASRTLEASRLTPVIDMVAQLEEAWAHAATQLGESSEHHPGTAPKGRY